MKARAKLIEGMAFLGEAGSGHSIVMDGSPESGGRNAGFRPMELLLVGLAGCTAFDVVLILRRGREDVADCIVEVSAERAPEDPKVFTKLHLDYRVKGRNLDEAKVKRAVELSKEKYCSASIMLGKTAEMTFAYTVEAF
ncbi:MAG: OsmC family protein [Methylobacterium sp.]|jgi:putative redox protein|nr:OsmC family protein [Methylobacterium sp.]MCA3598730.1 OsmC family protein [Methylobacterium sp.]MCA3603630.1 OsmC family protein [Methylobacterium sp.]MCA3614454.1 OsmC family protein [Methylobacterium sp.]MCA3627672.1 OsmC family protein [Methylobacterium sp.]